MFKYIIALSALGVSALAQNVIISQPPAGTTVTPGENITVQITLPDFQGSSAAQIAVALGLASCGSSCAGLGPSQGFGSVLFEGLYDPKAYATGSVNDWQYENFTVTVPPDYQAGEASLQCAHFSLTGAGPFPYLDVANITLTVQS